MLSESTVSYVSELAEQLSQAGVGVRAIAYTPLANVVSAANPCVTDVLVTRLKNAPDVSVAGVLTSATANTSDMSEHTAVVSALSEQLAQSVKRHISVARSTVRPVVTAYAESVLTRIQSFKHADPADDFKVEKVYIPEPLLNETLLADLSYHKNRDIPELRETLNVGACTDEELVSNLFTGSKSTDEAIREWLGCVDMALLRKVWDTHFAVDTPSMNLQYQYSISDRVNGALALYLYSRKLTNNVSGNVKMASMVYQSRISAIEYYAGAIVCSVMKELTLATTTDRMVLAIIPSARSIVLYGPVYDRYLQEGGSVEVILGLLSEGISATSLEGVRAVSEKALQGWNRYISLSNYQNKKNRAEMLRSIYMSEYVASLSDMDSFEKEYHDAHPGAADVSIKRTRDYLESLTEAELENINKISIKVIADYRFSYTQAYQILTDMEHALEANPNLDPREAATIAVINLVTDYVSAQLQRV